MDYHLYHDETKVEGYWHGILLVPKHQKSNIISLLNKVRENVRYDSDIGIKNVSRVVSGPFGCAQGFLNVGLYALMSNLKGQKYNLDLRGRHTGKYTYDLQVEETIGAKLIVYRERDNLTKIDLYPDPCSIVETTSRFAIKGGLHYLGNGEQPIRITKMHFDGHQHHGRNIDKRRLVERMIGLRGYASILDHDDLIDDRHSKHKKPGSMGYEDCQLIQLTDLLVGSFRTSYGYSDNPVHKRLAKNTVKPLVQKIMMGSARMQNSRWNKSVYTGQCNYAEGVGWNFADIQPKAVAVIEQATLF